MPLRTLASIIFCVTTERSISFSLFEFVTYWVIGVSMPGRTTVG
jgi:hypothetical protein